jgi:tetratricopeptide (TPR) repeat protein
MIKPAENQNAIRFCVYSALLLSLVACGSAPPRLPLAINQAKKADQEAHRAMRDGDFYRARDMFKQSLLIQQSLENIPAGAIAAVNLSSVSHKLGDDRAALDMLDGVLDDHSGLVTSELRAAAAFRKGVILADSGKPGDAEMALQLAMKECNKHCEYLPGVNNLHARLMFEKGDFTSALAIATEVIHAGGEKEEQANAHRIAAAAEAELGHHEAALAHYQATLDLDKELALSVRIAEDLKGISKVLQKQGRIPESDDYAHRAESVENAARMLHGNTPK